MGKDSLATPSWNPSSFGMEMQSNELNCGSQQLPNSLFNANWDNSMDQSDPFESALSSIVSSPAASNAAIAAGKGSSDGEMIRELIGRLGSICNSGEISSHPYICGNNTTNTSCYSTPLNSSPKLNLSMIDPQMRGNLPIPGNHLPSHPSLAPLQADPGFVERAARFSCFGGGNFGGLNGQVNLNEAELAYRSMPTIDSGKLSRASSNQSLKVAAGSQLGVQESNKSSPQGGNSAPDKKFSRFSRSSTPENAELGDSREGSSVSEQIPGGDMSVKAENVTNSRKRKPVARGKAKETPSSPSVKDGKFLSMKLSTVNPRMDLNMEALLSKEILQSRGSLQNALYQLDSAIPSFPFGYQPQQLPPLHSSSISSGTETQFPENPLNAAMRQSQGMQLPTFDRFGGAAPQAPQFFEDDLQSVVQMGFGQIQQESLHGSMASAQMKVEL
ncbi:bHLH transcription factor [Prunus yedoensis var. nudiflora]|uniref:BHLH transcription factor n=1 Tax=Prunus yedoensis var. nudiflora TaxID=2094558 RepID=A0A314XKE7_PRUYE|nr:bHLH transcription factor [Prunus yedoensis var. nudiflora]